MLFVGLTAVFKSKKPRSGIPGCLWSEIATHRVRSREGRPRTPRVVRGLPSRSLDCPQVHLTGNLRRRKPSLLRSLKSTTAREYHAYMRTRLPKRFRKASLPFSRAGFAAMSRCSRRSR